MLAPWKKSYGKPRQPIKKQRHHFTDKGPYSQSYGFFPVVMYGCESWTIKMTEWAKNWYFWTVVVEKTLESPLDCKEIKPVNPRGNQSWIFIGRTDAEAEAPILWPAVWRADSLEKTLLIGKNPDAGKDWRQKEKGAAESKMAG